MKIFFSKQWLASAICMVCLLLIKTVFAQLTISNGAQFIMTGNAQLTLDNIDLNNNGNFVPGAGTLSFTGNASSVIEGGQPCRFYNLQLNKLAGAKLTLLQPISIGRQVDFTAGLLDLNGYDADLGSTGLLNGEQESSRVVGSKGGNIIFTTTLNAPNAANPGNLGLLISTAQNLGNTTIRRGQQSQVNLWGSGSSVLRYYDILPASNTSLNATLRLPYFASELNGLDENTLVFWEKPTAAAWNELGFESRNTALKYVEKTTVAALGRFTLSSINNALPVQFLLFTAGCNGNAAMLHWTTAQEFNSRNFAVQKSIDGIRWVTIGKLAAAGNSNTGNDYYYADNSNNTGNFFRIAEFDADGKSKLTKIISADCSRGTVAAMWPNPVKEWLYVSLPVGTVSNAVIKLFDGKGALVKQQAEKVLPGNNQFPVYLNNIAAGIYYITVNYNNGKLYTQKIIKE